jgi:integrase
MGAGTSAPPTATERTKYRYGLYFHKQTAPDGSNYTKPLIVLRNDYGDIVRFTRLHGFADASASKLFVPIASSGKERLYHICSMLNWIIIEQYDRFRIDNVLAITKESLNGFFQSYAIGADIGGSPRARVTVEKCISNIVEFFLKLKQNYGNTVALNTGELFTEQAVYGRNGRRAIKRVPVFQARGVDVQSDTFRELPTEAFKILLSLSFRYAPDIAFALCLQAFAGLRAGEALNVRQESSPLGSGIVLTRIGSFVRKIEIDLTRELQLRSDGVVVGGIKKPRVQCVYPPFIQAFAAAYEQHKAWLSAHRFESDYAPMFVNSKGLAMTYKDYAYRFKQLTERFFRPAALASDDEELRIYGQLLYENSLGLHALRHWFSVQLVLHGEDIAQVQFWRGDKSPESAFVYLRNKGDLVRELETSSEFLTEILMREGASLLNGGSHE